MAAPSLPSPLRLLSTIIASSIDTLETHLASAGLSFPTLDQPYNPTGKAEALLLRPDLSAATAHIVAAAAQLIACVRHPAQSVIDDAMSFHLGSCMRAVLETDAVEIIREAGPEGIHVRDLAAQTNKDPLKFSRILRLLANHHIFNEVSPDVFAANRLSSLLDTGKSTRELVENPKDKFTGTSGIAAFVLHSTDEVMKGSAYLPEAFTDSMTAHSVETTESPFNIAFGTGEVMFSWMDLPENRDRQRRLAIAIAGTTKMEPADAILKGYEFVILGFKWESLPEGSKIVDVGGGVGSSSLVIAKNVPGVNIVLQDRASVIEEGHEFWTREYPEAIKEGRIKLQEHNFFDHQPIKDADAFLLRFITHDWADPQAKQILTHLRNSATANTKLITIDIIVPYTCHADICDDIPGAALPPVPQPLLPNLGAAANMSYWMDLQMYVLLNSQDRTLGHFVQLAAESGWKVIQVHHIPGSTFGQCVSVPM